MLPKKCFDFVINTITKFFTKCIGFLKKAFNFCVHLPKRIFIATIILVLSITALIVYKFLKNKTINTNEKAGQIKIIKPKNLNNITNNQPTINNCKNQQDIVITNANIKTYKYSDELLHQALSLNVTNTQNLSQLINKLEPTTNPILKVSELNSLQLKNNNWIINIQQNLPTNVEFYTLKINGYINFLKLNNQLNINVSKASGIIFVLNNNLKFSYFNSYNANTKQFYKQAINKNFNIKTMPKEYSYSIIIFGIPKGANFSVNQVITQGQNNFYKVIKKATACINNNPVIPKPLQTIKPNTKITKTPTNKSHNTTNNPTKNNGQNKPTLTKTKPIQQTPIPPTKIAQATTKPTSMPTTTQKESLSKQTSNEQQPTPTLTTKIYEPDIVLNNDKNNEPNESKHPSIWQKIKQFFARFLQILNK